MREQRNEDEEGVAFRDGSELRVLEGGGLQDRRSGRERKVAWVTYG